VKGLEWTGIMYTNVASGDNRPFCRRDKQIFKCFFIKIERFVFYFIFHKYKLSSNGVFMTAVSSYLSVAIVCNLLVPVAALSKA
jgi:hypothetical protein